jgi:hypothetical protein
VRTLTDGSVLKSDSHFIARTCSSTVRTTPAVGVPRDPSVLFWVLTRGACSSSPIQRSCFRCVPVFFVLPKHPSDGLENRNNDAPHEGGQLEEPAATPGGSHRDVVSLGREVISHTERRATKRAGDKGAFSVDLMPAQG